MHTPHFELYSKRRQQLVKYISREYTSPGIVLLSAGAENECSVFKQDSTFYYFTGLTEPGLVCVLDTQDKSTLLVPRYAAQRDVWLATNVELTQENANHLGFDRVEYLGDTCPGYSLGEMTPFERPLVYQQMQNMVRHLVDGSTIYMPDPATLYQKTIYDLVAACKQTSVSLSDITPIVAAMRRTKEASELDACTQAIAITAQAQEAAAEAIQPGVNEAYVKAALEYVMIAEGMRPAFSSIVAAGHNSTVLHYTDTDKILADGDLVVVDIGAEYQGYAADITRTYPASGTFSRRQAEIYQLVLDAQEYIAAQAKPGYWLRNSTYPEKSLHHMAVEFFRQKGDYHIYFVHGIGHYLGLDVHDVGSYQEPLAPGDLFTIEPGLYIRTEGIGIRIEDNYYITPDGAKCLSSTIPKTIADIEKLMQPTKITR